jgi:2-polyprenyl-3-methyl-5-hydroxy-6-metoxy-1,4-benzoquinol methylase
MKSYSVSYLERLNGMYGEKTFQRKVDYIRYNLGEYFDAKVASGLEVLEVGPGVGEFVNYAQSIGIRRVDILDEEEDIIGSLKSGYRDLLRNVYSSVSTLKTSKDRYDFVVLIQVLEHIPLDRQAETLSVLYRSLKKYGKLFVVVPNANNPLGLTERYGDIQHKVSFTSRSVRDLISESGIRNDETKIMSFRIPPYSIINIIRIMVQKAIHLLIYLLLIANGGVFYRPLTPNMLVVIEKKS